MAATIAVIGLFMLMLALIFLLLGEMLEDVFPSIDAGNIGAILGFVGVLVLAVAGFVLVISDINN